MDAEKAKIVIQNLILNGKISLDKDSFSDQDILRALFLARNSLDTIDPPSTTSNNIAWEEYTNLKIISGITQDSPQKENKNHQDIVEEHTFSTNSVFGEDYLDGFDDGQREFLDEIYSDADSYSYSDEDGWYYYDHD
tara:strand:- start:928 stop:1338 length:411 start_codon:yes stop_codon:yes gene_type:complete